MIKNAIDPNNPDFHKIPLWCVYGDDCFPSMLCCRISTADGTPTIWGYSVWRREPGFRTLGINLVEWIKREKRPRFFANHADALAYIGKLTTPKV